MSAHVMHLVNELCQASSNTMVINLCHGLRERGYQVTLASLGPSDEPMRVRLDEVGISPIYAGEGGAVAAVGRVARLVRDAAVDLVHTHVLRADLIGATGARLGGAPAVVSTKHNTGYVPGQRGWRVRQALFWPTARLADHLVAVSNVQREELVGRLRLDPDRVDTIYAGLDTQRFWRPEAREETRRSLGLGPEDVAVVYAGRLVGGKGLEALVSAAPIVLSRCPQVRFIIMGDGYLRPQLEAATELLTPPARVLFTGFRSDVPEVLSAADVSVLASRSEGLPLAAVEAMAAGKALIATAAGGLAELVQDGVTGLEVPIDDVETLADAVVALGEDAALRARLGKAGRRFVESRFSVERMVAAHDALYRRLLERRGYTVSVPQASHRPE